MSEDVKEKISKSLMGHSVTDEMKKLYSDNLKAGIGCYKYWQGKKRSRETTEKILKTLKVRRVRCIETGEIFPCARDACKKYDINPANMSAHLNGRRKSVKKLHFKFTNND